MYCDVMAFISPVTRSWQVQESTIDNYTDNKLDCIFYIDHKDSELITIKKAPTITCPMQCLQWLASLSFQYGGFVNKANYVGNSS